MTSTETTIKQIVARLNGVFPVDDALLESKRTPFCPSQPSLSVFLTSEVLPAGQTLVSAEHSAKSAWTITGKLTARTCEGSQTEYFVKVHAPAAHIKERGTCRRDLTPSSQIAFGESGRIMLRGECESSKVIHSIMPDFIPTPIGFGQFRAPGPATYFYVAEYVDMDVTSRPDPAEFCGRLAQLHRESKSPNGKFGFHVATCDGDRPHVVDWEESWAVFYRKLFLGVCERDVQRNGPWPAYERAIQQVARRVIPRLLDGLLEGGRPIKPSLIHGDLWEGNMGVAKATGKSTLFDAGSYYGHNEMELGAWRCEYTSVFRDREYVEQYLRHYPAADPAHEFDDRNRLYSLKGAINYSAGHPGSELRKT